MKKKLEALICAMGYLIESHREMIAYAEQEGNLPHVNRPTIFVKEIEEYLKKKGTEFNLEKSNIVSKMLLDFCHAKEYNRTLNETI